MQTKTRLLLLTHPKEYRRQRTGTGRLAAVNLANCEIVPGLAFDGNPRVRAILGDPEQAAFLLYPSPGAIDLGEAAGQARLASLVGGRSLAVFLIDSTWSCSHAVLRESRAVAALPRLAFVPSQKSRWIIKRQPRETCLSTIEAIHELLGALEAAGLESYPDKGRLLRAFAAMQEYQIARAAAAPAPRYLHGA
jgi:DTW domain-containing protein